MARPTMAPPDPLPDDLKQQCWQEHLAFEREGKMPYVMTVERDARAEGLEEGERKELLAGLEIILELKFGEAGLALLPEIRTLRNVPLLRTVREALRTATTLDAVREVYREHLPPPEPPQQPKPPTTDVP